MRLIWLSKPGPKRLSRFLAEQAELDFSYGAVGATAQTPPPGFVVDRTRVALGHGEAAFEAAKTALRQWRQFQLGWIEAWPLDTPLEAGRQVAVMGRAMGLWWLNCCRIVYTVDESADMDTATFGFAYGTLPGHLECGEERFVVEWDRRTDQVSYDILAFSRPNHLLARLGRPLVRRQQQRFGRDSAASMLRAVQDQ